VFNCDHMKWSSTSGKGGYHGHGSRLDDGVAMSVSPIGAAGAGPF